MTGYTLPLFHSYLAKTNEWKAFFTKEHIPYVLIDKTVKQKGHLVLNFPEQTQQTDYVLLWSGIKPSSLWGWW